MTTKEELEKKKKSWSGITKGLHSLFDGNADSTLNKVISNFTPDKNGKTPGLSGMSVWSALKFVITNPINTYNLIKLAKSPEIYTDPDFQKNLIEDPKLWSMVEKKATDLPKIGKMLDGFGIKEFKEGNILDTKGLTAIGKALQNGGNLKEIKDITLKAMSPNPDWMNIGSDGLGLLAKDPNFSEYLKVKGDSIGNYVATNLSTITGADVTRTVDNLVKDEKYKDIRLALEKQPEFKVALSAHLANNISITDPAQQQSIDKIPGLEKLNLSKDATTQLTELSKETSSKAQTFAQETYGIDKNKAQAVSKIVPILLDSPSDLKTILDSVRNKDYQKMTVDLLSMMDKKPSIAEYFKDNRDIFVDILDKTFKNTPALANLNLKGELYDLVPNLMKHPKELIDIINTQKTGDYAEVGKKFLNIVEKDPSIAEYFKEKGTLLAEIGVKAAGLNNYGIDGEVGKVFGLLMKSGNKEKIQGLIDHYQKGETLKIITSTCKLIEEDPEFKKYMGANKDNFAKIVTAVIDQNPGFKTYTKGADVGQIVGNMLKDPKSIGDFVTAYEKGGAAMYAGGAKLAYQKLTDAEFLKAVAGAAASLLVGTSTAQQELSSTILQQVSTREDTKTPLNLTDFVKNTINSSQLGDKSTKANELINRNILFDGVKIQGSEKLPLKLDNLIIDGNSFVNSTIENTSFKNTEFKGASFVGASFKNVDFKDSTIDGNTLRSMIDGIKKGNISLDGVKLKGDLSGIDLSKISLKGADLTQVTSLKDVNLQGTNLLEAKLSSDSKILTETYNLDKAKMKEGAIKNWVHEAQKTYVIIKAVEKLAEVVERDKLGEKMTPEQKTNCVQKIQELVNANDEVGKYIKKSLEISPDDLINAKFPLKAETVKHGSEYLDKTNNIMTVLLENRNTDPATMRNAVAANMIADSVTKSLFDTVQDRGKDGLLIKKIMKEASTEFLKENPGSDIAKVFGSEGKQSLEENIKQKLYDKTKYTVAGNINGGVYLPENVAQNRAITMDIKTQLHEKCGAVQLSESEKAQIQIMTNKIGENLFADGKEGRRKLDTEIIQNNLKDAFLKVKIESKGVDLTKAIEQTGSELSGKVDKGYFTTDRTGLTKLFYDNSTNTKAGVLTGGIYLDETKIRSEEFVKTIKTSLSDKLQPLLNIEIEKSSKSSSKSKAESGQHRVSDVMTPPPTPKNANQQTRTSSRDSR